jgi:hypothetical protein
MRPGMRTRKDPEWPMREVLVGCYLLSLAGCGEEAPFWSDRSSGVQ